MTHWWSRMVLGLAVAVLLVGGSSCAKKQEDVAQSSQPVKESAKPDKPQIPEEFMTQAARLLGAPFDRKIHLKLTRSDPSGETESYVYRSTTISVGDGAVTVDTKMVNAPEGLNQGETYELRKDGVWAIAVAGSNFDPPFLAMPAQITAGLKWSYETTAAQMNLKADAVAVRKETIKVPLGEFEAWRIETKGTLEAQNVSGTLEDVSFYVEGIGIVKAETTYVSKSPGPDGKPVKMTNKARLEAIPEP